MPPHRPPTSYRTKHDLEQMRKFDRSNRTKESFCVTCHDKTIDRRKMLEENNKHNMTLDGI